jgi:hypothetical protein
MKEQKQIESVLQEREIGIAGGSCRNFEAEVQEGASMFGSILFPVASIQMQNNFIFAIR